MWRRRVRLWSVGRFGPPFEGWPERTKGCLLASSSHILPQDAARQFPEPTCYDSAQRTCSQDGGSQQFP